FLFARGRQGCHASGVDERSTPLNVGDLTRLREEPKPPGLLLDDGVLPRAQLVEIDGRLPERNAKGVGMPGVIEDLRRMQERFRRDAAPERADATWIGIGVDQGDLHAE